MHLNGKYLREMTAVMRAFSLAKTVPAGDGGVK